MNSKYICRYRERNTILVNDRGTLRFLNNFIENINVPYIDELSPIYEIQFEIQSSGGNTMISNAHLLFECENNIIVLFSKQKSYGVYHKNDLVSLNKIYTSDNLLFIDNL